MGERVEGGSVGRLGDRASRFSSAEVVCVLVAQSCPTVCDPMDCSLPDSSVHGILQARILSELPFLSPENLPDPGIEPGSPTLQGDSSPSEPAGKPSAEVNMVKSPISFHLAGN